MGHYSRARDDGHAMMAMVMPGGITNLNVHRAMGLPSSISRMISRNYRECRRRGVRAPTPAL